MYRPRLDSRDKFPSGMEDYLAQNGWHFNKKMCDWAVSNMKKRNASYKNCTKEDVDNMMVNYNVKIDNNVGYDAVYVANMCKSDFLGSSILDDLHVIKYVKDVLDDVDGYDGIAFTRFYADCIGSGTPIPWEDLL